MDADQNHLKDSDQLTLKATTYRLIKAYRLESAPGATMTGIATEIEALKADGFDVTMSLTSGGAVLDCVRVQELTDLAQLEEVMNGTH